MIRVPTIPVLWAITAAASAVGGYLVADWRLTADIERQAHERVTKAFSDLSTMTKQRDALAAQLQAAGDRHAAQLKDAQDETNRLRDRERAGAVRLRVAAVCPDIPDVPEASPGAGLDTGTGAELDSASRQAYFALRDGIDRTSAQLAACQDELRLRAQ